MSDPAPTQSPYDRIGGEPTIRRLVERFYDLMETTREGHAARAIHGPDLGPSREKLFMYFTGWLGGPPLFTDRYGPPMLRRRHLHAAIATLEIEAWLTCFRQAWSETVNDPPLTAVLMPQIENLARHMRTREDQA
ncbi:MAG: group II truncated hemoglobin [Alphaproteobacteria bacterium]|nr:group II truncated hemoglobin [Alphaproteobacteria bacterium]